MMEIFTAIVTNNLKKKAAILIVFAVLGGIVLEIWVTNRLVTYGEKIAEIQNAGAKLRMENQVLQNQISEQASLNQMKKYASGLGFRSGGKVEYISGSLESLGMTTKGKTLTVDNALSGN